MNDELSSSADDTLRERDTLAHGESAVTGERDGALSSADDGGNEWAKERARRISRLDEMLRGMDILIYMELAAVYYMDNSFLRFALRGLVQFFYLTPKSIIFPEAPKERPYVGSILGTNIFCFILHMYLSRPQAGEATRGYLHGGLLIDFVGQLGPSSKLHLFILDVWILLLQLVMLAACMERQRLKSPPSSATPAGTRATEVTGASQQDHDAEERGVLRESSGTSDNAHGMADLDENTEHDQLLASSSQPETSRSSSGESYSREAYYSAQAIVVDLHVWNTVYEQYWAYQNRPATPATVVDAGTRGLVANLAGRRLGVRMGIASR